MLIYMTEFHFETTYRIPFSVPERNVRSPAEHSSELSQCLKASVVIADEHFRLRGLEYSHYVFVKCLAIQYRFHGILCCTHCLDLHAVTVFLQTVVHFC